MTAERYTAVFTGFLKLKRPGEYLYLTVGGDSPGNGGGELRRGQLPYERLRSEIQFQDFPEGFQAIVLDTYREHWGL